MALALLNPTLNAQSLSAMRYGVWTVENKTSFHQRTLQYPQDLHIHTSYPNAATLVLLHKLNPNMEFLHLGDADPARIRHSPRPAPSTHLPFRSVGMEVRPADDSPRLTREEVRLLECLASDPVLAPELPTAVLFWPTGARSL